MTDMFLLNIYNFQTENASHYCCRRSAAATAAVRQRVRQENSPLIGTFLPSQCFCRGEMEYSNVGTTTHNGTQSVQKPGNIMPELPGPKQRKGSWMRQLQSHWHLMGTAKFAKHICCLHAENQQISMQKF